jgi:hypothetical protein
MVGAVPEAASAGTGDCGAGAFPGAPAGFDAVVWCVARAGAETVSAPGLGRLYVRSSAVVFAVGVVSWCGGATFA